jgi:hypothetical protein
MARPDIIVGQQDTRVLDDIRVADSEADEETWSLSMNPAIGQLSIVEEQPTIQIYDASDTALPNVNQSGNTPRISIGLSDTGYGDDAVPSFLGAGRLRVGGGDVDGGLVVRPADADRPRLSDVSISANPPRIEIDSDDGGSSPLELRGDTISFGTPDGGTVEGVGELRGQRIVLSDEAGNSATAGDQPSEIRIRRDGNDRVAIDEDGIRVRRDGGGSVTIDQEGILVEWDGTPRAGLGDDGLLLFDDENVTVRLADSGGAQLGGGSQPGVLIMVASDGSKQAVAATADGTAVVDENDRPILLVGRDGLVYTKDGQVHDVDQYPN